MNRLGSGGGVVGGGGAWESVGNWLIRVSIWLLARTGDLLGIVNKDWGDNGSRVTSGGVIIVGGYVGCETGGGSKMLMLMNVGIGSNNSFVRGYVSCETTGRSEIKEPL